MSIFSEAEDTKLAKDLKTGDRFEWVGSFGVYTALSDAKADPTFPGKVVLRADRVEEMGVRLDEDQQVMIWPSWGRASKYRRPTLIQNIIFEGKPFREGPKSGSLVAVRLAKSKETHVGFYLGEGALRQGAFLNEKDQTLKCVQGFYNPVMYVPALGRLVYGCESWWGFIESEDDLRKITDEDIENVWYVQMAMALSKRKDEKNDDPVDNQ